MDEDNFEYCDDYPFCDYGIGGCDGCCQDYEPDDEHFYPDDPFVIQSE